MTQEALSCTCFNLRAAARRITRRYDQTLAPSGLLSSQHSMLSFITAKPGCGVADLADARDMDISTATRNLRPLVAGGYVTVKPGSRDARRREIRVTAKGTRALEKARALWRRAQSETVAELGERGNRELLKLLAEVH